MKLLSTGGKQSNNNNYKREHNSCLLACWKSCPLKALVKLIAYTKTDTPQDDREEWQRDGGHYLSVVELGMTALEFEMVSSSVRRPFFGLFSVNCDKFGQKRKRESTYIQ